MSTATAELELDDELEEPETEHALSWEPTTYTRPLSEDFPSDGPRLRELVRLVWQDATAEGDGPFRLDEWQERLIDCVLERYPADHPDPSKAGRLRYRQVVISIPRQNGKSVLGAIFALYGLMLHSPGPYVLGVAKSAEQARIVYNRLLYVIQNHRLLKSKFSKMTETRGIRTADGRGFYEIKASRGDSLQGVPVSLGIFDELHITKPEVWQSLVNGQRRRRDGLLVGITTAGDEESELLIELYKLGQKAANGDEQLERFGYFVWEAPETRIPDTDAELDQFIIASNPFIRTRLELLPVMRSDLRAQPEADALRYGLNRFTASQSAFLPLEAWRDCQTRSPFPEGARVIFTIDRSPDWGYASIVATGKRPDGRIYSDLVASFVKPTLEDLVEACLELSYVGPVVYGMDGWQLRDLGDALKARGLPVRTTTQAELVSASGLLYARVTQRKLRHPGHPLLTSQVPRAVRKNVGDGYRISRKDSATEIDAVIATTLGVYLAEVHRDTPVQMF